MNNLNSVLLEGQIEYACCLPIDKNGEDICMFHINSSRLFKNKNNEIKKETMSIDAVAYGVLAQKCSLEISKDRKVSVVGRLTQYNNIFVNSDIHKMIIVAEHVEFEKD